MEINMFETMQGLKRTHKCAQLGKQNVGEQVVLMGFTNSVRNLGGLIFINLRDVSGIVQCVFNTDDQKMYEKAAKVRDEYVLVVVGTVAKRDEAVVNKNMATGDIEVIAKELRILSKAQTPPFYIEENSNVKEELRLKHRYLDLRRPDMQRRLILRSKVAQIVRNFFADNGFYEIETPILMKSTPEGARDYLVPSRVHPGKFYALPQSPQIYKQLLMISGMDRYFQIAKCFRDEDLRADRQPEFTQIDEELSFVDMDDVITLNEQLVAKIFKETKNIDIQTPFLRMPFSEAMDRFGSDKPDTRFGLELVDISDVVAGCDFKVFTGAIEDGGSVRAINAKNLADKISRKNIDSLQEFIKTYRAKGLAWIKVNADGIQSPIAKFMNEQQMNGILYKMQADVNDLILIVADKNKVVFDSLGALRIEVAKQNGLIDENKFNFLWVTDFPLLEFDEEENRYVAMHHPFTAPKDEDIEYLDSDPGKVRAKAYDIILNGVELGGGSMRIYNTELQEKMFGVIGLSNEEAWERFGFLLDAFKYGAPPHGGMAYGFDRLIMLLVGCDSIRDVMAFPKVQNACELMSGAPGFVDDKQLDELAINITKQEE